MGLFSAGIANFRRNYPLWPGLYVVRAGLTLVYTMPFLILTDNTLTASPYAEPLLKTWSLSVITELLSAKPNVLTSFVLIMLFFVVLVFLVKQFLNGGIYYTFLSQERLERYSFFGESARLMGGNLKISAIIIVIYFALILASLFFADFVPGDAFGHYGASALWAALARLLVVYAFLIPGFVLDDILRLRLAANPGEPLVELFRAAIGFWRANFVKCYGTYAAYFTPFLAIMFVAEWLAVTVTSGLGSMIGVVLELLLFQLVILAQIGQSLLFTATLAPVFRSAQPGRFKQIVQEELRFD